MSKFIKNLKSSLKWGAYGMATIGMAGFGFLQYVNIQVGPIDVDKNEAIQYYTKSKNMSQREALKMYYFVYWNIIVARITGYIPYTSYCNKLREKIVQPALEKYRNQGILQQIDKMQGLASKLLNRKTLYYKIGKIRKQNIQQIQTWEYIIQSVRQLQREMNITRILGVSQSQKQDIDKLQAFIVSTGVDMRDPDVLSYSRQLPSIQKKFPNDFLHKILII